MTALMPAPARDVTVVATPPHLDLGRERRVTLAPLGASLAEIVAVALPDLPEGRRTWLRVSVGPEAVPARLWPHVRPKAGVPVVIRLVPAGGGGLRQILMIAVAVAAMAIGQFWVGPMMAGTFGLGASTWAAIGTAATMMAGSLLVNALVPMQTSKSGKDAARYAISGQQNVISPDAPIPLVLGDMRFAPPYAALPYTEEVGDTEQYYYGLFIVGVGAHAITDLRIGDTPIERYQGVNVEIRNGYATDPPLTLITQQVYEEATQAQLSQADGPIRRVSGGDAAAISVTIRFPGGLIQVNSKGKKLNMTVSIVIRARLAGAATWETVGTLSITRKTAKDFRIAHRWDCGVRGRYEIEIERLTPDYDDSDTVQAATHVVAIRTFRPEYPLAMPAGAPLALIALRIRASRQLQSMIDNLTCRARPLVPDWDAALGAWTTRETRNCASLARHLLTGPHCAYPMPDAQTDLARLVDWHDHCAVNGLVYDGVITEERQLREAMAEVCAAGRARPYDRAGKWSVAIDRPVDLATAMISARNARALKSSSPYTRYPDAVRVKFYDRSNDCKPTERVVPWIGYEGVPNTVEQWELPGLTDPASVWSAARLRMREVMARRTTYTAMQDVEHLAVELGERVLFAPPTLSEEAVAARVVSAAGTRVVIDAPVAMVEGASYRLRLCDPGGTPRMVDLVTRPGAARELALTAPLDPPPAPGAHALVGRCDREPVDCIVTGVEPGDEWSATLTLQAHAPHIHTETAADVAPAWDGRAGGVVIVTAAPAAPAIASILSGYELSDPTLGVVVVVAPATGETIPLRGFDLRWREGAGVWIDVADAPREISFAASVGAQIEVQARAVSIGGVRGAWSAIITHEVKPATTPGPVVASLIVDKMTTGARRYTWILATPAGSDLASQVGVELRLRAGAGWAWDDLTPLHSGLLIASPWEASVPADDGVYTVGARASNVAGDVGPPLLVAVATQPAAPQSIAAARVSSDIRVTLGMSVAQDSGSARVYRSLASAAASTEIDVSGLLAAPPAASVVWTDVGAAGAGKPTYRYRARAENSAGVKSLPTNEVLP